MNSRESNQIGWGLFEHHLSKIRVRSCPGINYNRHIDGFRPERRFDNFRRRRDYRMRGVAMSRQMPNSSKQICHTSMSRTWQAVQYDPTMARLPLSDILHRGIVYSLAGLTVCGVVMAVFVHRDTMQRGRGVWQITLNCPMQQMSLIPRVNSRTLFYYSRLTSVCKWFFFFS